MYLPGEALFTECRAELVTGGMSHACHRAHFYLIMEDSLTHPHNLPSRIQQHGRAATLPLALTALAARLLASTGASSAPRASTPH